MASELQINANRQNAQKSTGPRTDAGKARSSQSALVHGLTARRFLLPIENAEQFATFWDDACAYFAPENAEVEMVRDWVELTWRLRRVPAFETAIFTTVSNSELPLEQRGNAGDWLISHIVSRVLKSDVLRNLQRYEASLHKRLVAITKLLLDMRKARARPLPRRA